MAEALITRRGGGKTYKMYTFTGSESYYTGSGTQGQSIKIPVKAPLTVFACIGDVAQLDYHYANGNATTFGAYGGNGNTRITTWFNANTGNLEVYHWNSGYNSTSYTLKVIVMEE